MTTDDQEAALGYITLNIVDAEKRFANVEMKVPVVQHIDILAGLDFLEVTLVRTGDEFVASVGDDGSEK